MKFPLKLSASQLYMRYQLMSKRDYQQSKHLFKLKIIIRISALV